MRALDPFLGRLYRGTFLFGLACGISIALTSLYLDAAGYTKADIGTLALFFAGGLVSFAVPMGKLIQRFGARRTLLAALAGYALSVGAFPLAPSYGAIAAVRFVDGACSVAVWISSETLVLSRADRQNKAHLTSLYAIWLASGYVAGPLLAKALASLITQDQAFYLSSVIAFTGVAYFALRLPRIVERAPHVDDLELEAPVGDATPATSALEIFRRIKTSCLAAFSYGYFQSSVVLFLPLYLIESKGIDRDDTIILPGLFCLGMLLCSNAAGRIADRVGHLRVVALLCTAGTLCVLGFVFLNEYWLMCVAVFGAGATFASMSPVALALTGVVTAPRDYARVNSLYNVFYATGMLVGPPLASIVFQRWGGVTMLYHLGALWAAYVAFAVIFIHDDPASRRAWNGPSETARSA